MFQICISLLCLVNSVQLAPNANVNHNAINGTALNIEKWKQARGRIEAAVRNMSTSSSDRSIGGGPDGISAVITKGCKEIFDGDEKSCPTFRACCNFECQYFHLQPQSQCTNGGLSPRCQCKGTGPQPPPVGSTERPNTRPTDKPRPRPSVRPVPPQGDNDGPLEGENTRPLGRRRTFVRPVPGRNGDGPGEEPHAESRGSCGKSTVQSDRLVGGQEATQWPWQISLLYAGSSWSHICGGSIIDEYHILTAAHCVEQDPDPENYQVVLGLNSRMDLEDVEGNILTVSRITIHPKRHRMSYNGAILRLSRPIQFTSAVSPVCLPQQDVSSREKNCFASSRAAEVLIQVPAPIVNASTCGRFAEQSNIPFSIDSSMICASTKNRGTCKGDSGGPLVCHQGESWTLYGISSWGDQDCDTKIMPDVYGRVMAMMDWIQETIR